MCGTVASMCPLGNPSMLSSFVLLLFVFFLKNKLFLSYVIKGYTNFDFEVSFVFALGASTSSDRDGRGSFPFGYYSEVAYCGMC